MPAKNNSGRLVAACFLLGAAALAAILLRRQDLTSMRPAPGFRALGPAGAPVVINEFSDFACPACKVGTEYAERLVEANKGRVRLNFKHNPLTNIHPWSVTAALYADCAGRQGKFWEYGKLLFEGMEKWGKAPQKPAQFEEYARSLGLDYAAMESCVSNPETMKAVRLDMAEGELKKIDSTPTFFVNKRRAVGGPQMLKVADAFEGLTLGKQGVK
ncbi:MAG: DsbA family protein [Elusimicrobiales bacterium]